MQSDFFAEFQLGKLRSKLNTDPKYSIASDHS